MKLDRFITAIALVCVGLVSGVIIEHYDTIETKKAFLHEIKAHDLAIGMVDEFKEADYQLYDSLRQNKDCFKEYDNLMGDENVLCW